MNKTLAKILLGLAITVGCASAQIVVRIGPPPIRREFIPRPPTPRHVWVAGYHRWDGRAYAWVPGTYVLPPRPYFHRWVPGHWRSTPNGWFWIEGHWRR